MIAAPSGISGSAFCTVNSIPFTLMLKIEVEKFFGDLAERRIFRDAGIGEHDIELALVVA